MSCLRSFRPVAAGAAHAPHILSGLRQLQLRDYRRRLLTAVAAGAEGEWRGWGGYREAYRDPERRGTDDHAHTREAPGAQPPAAAHLMALSLPWTLDHLPSSFSCLRLRLCD